jgi:glutamate racemase
VKYLFSQGCPLIIIACNTASAKALRNIQQLDLPKIAPDRRVLGVIRPSVEKVAEITKNGHVGVLGTPGTVTSESYPIELEKWSEGKVVSTVQEACPLWVPVVENNEINSEGANYFIKKNIQNILQKDRHIDTLIMGCTHYPLLVNVIRKYVPDNIRILEQGNIVAEKLLDYLKRHPEMERRLSKSKNVTFQTTEDKHIFMEKAALFLGKPVDAVTIHL